ncbi:MAG TPA: hypothetical protein VF691_09230 [Cytophagaceae bacterium]|jgi:hypothetical protein
MDEEKQFLLDILKVTPINSIWAISQDSLENLPNEFKERFFEIRGNNLCIEILDENKYYLQDLINKFDIHDKVIHQYIYFDNGQLMFKGYDHLTSCFIHKEFPEVNNLIEKYSDILNLME